MSTELFIGLLLFGWATLPIPPRWELGLLQFAALVAGAVMIASVLS